MTDRGPARTRLLVTCCALLLISMGFARLSLLMSSSSLRDGPASCASFVRTPRQHNMAAYHIIENATTTIHFHYTLAALQFRGLRVSVIYGGGQWGPTVVCGWLSNARLSTFSLPSNVRLIKFLFFWRTSA
jgi:hypothetical protein